MPLRHGHSHHLAPWQRVGVHAVGALLLATGAAWLALHYTIGGASELPHPAEPWLMRLHGLAAFASLFMLGVLAAAHVPAGWRLGARAAHHAPQRRTGAVLCGLGTLLALSGWLLYYFAPEAVRPALGWAHAGLGLAMGGMLDWHRRQRRRLARRARRA